MKARVLVVPPGWTLGTAPGGEFRTILVGRSEGNGGGSEESPRAGCVRGGVAVVVARGGGGAPNGRI